MPPLKDPVILALYKSALSNYRYEGYITWKATALEWLGKELSGFPYRAVNELLCKHVEAGGEIDQVSERRPEWNDRDYRYDIRLPIAGRLLYVETILVDDDPDDPLIQVVSIHDA
jgi:hypothetical protein